MPRYNQNGDGGGFRLLPRTHNATCPCCSTPNRRTLWRFNGYTYCTTCLHSIGWNAAGNACTAAQYAAAWRELST